jgi:hypothetical protein
MLCSKKMILPSKFNVKLQKIFRGGGSKQFSEKFEKSVYTIKLIIFF